MENLEYEELEITATVSKKTLLLDWKGNIHAANPGDFLNPYLEECIEYAEENAFNIVSDFSNLDYLNSASIPPLIQMLRDLNESKIHGEFLYDETRKVQVASFKALNVIASKSSFTKVTGKK